jgi:hypothetical protein
MCDFSFGYTITSLLLTRSQVHAAAVCLVVPRLLALADFHMEAAAALRVVFEASPAAVAARDVFRSMKALLHQLPSAMFVRAANLDNELSVISQLRSIICTRKSSFAELENLGGAVACNSFVILGGVGSLIACFKSDLCANKVLTTCRPQSACLQAAFAASTFSYVFLQTDAFRISEVIGNCISNGTACSAAALPPLSLCAAALSRFADPRLEESERVRSDSLVVVPFNNYSACVTGRLCAGTSSSLQKFKQHNS